MGLPVDWPRLCVVTDGRPKPEDLVPRVERLLECGVRWISIREPRLGGGSLLAMLERLRRTTRDRGARLTVHDRCDLARLVGSDGVHLAQHSIPAARARELLGPNVAVGVSVHDGSELRAAEAGGADYVFLGPAYETPSKRGILEPLGAERFGSLVEGADVPVFAIGGIRPGRVRALRDAGAAGIAVVSFLMSSPDPASDVPALLEETRW